MLLDRPDGAARANAIADSIVREAEKRMTAMSVSTLRSKQKKYIDSFETKDFDKAFRDE